MIYDSNVSNMDQDIETEDVGMNKSIVNSTNPFRKEAKNGNFNIAESSFSKMKDSRYNTNDPSYISQFNDAFLAVGPEIKEPKTQEIQMDELRKYFETKIVNAYNSLYLDPNNDANVHLTDAEKMIRKIIIKVNTHSLIFQEKNKAKSKNSKHPKEKLRIKINAKKIMKELINEKMNHNLPLEEILGEESKHRRDHSQTNRK